MAIALRAAGTPTGATAAVTAVNPAVPAGTTTGDLSVLTVVVKPYTATITTPTGWTKIGEYTNGTVAQGADVGSMKVALYVRESAPVGAIGNIVMGSTPNSAMAVIHSYQKSAAEGWDYSSFTSGGDTTNGANFAATGAAGVNVATGDWLIAAVAVNSDLGTVSGQSISGISGAIVGTIQNRTNAVVTTGNDARLVYSDTTIDAGSSNVAPTFSYTNASSTSGAVMWLRLRVTNLNPKTQTLTDDFAVDNRATKWPNSYGTTGVSGGTATTSPTGATNYTALLSTPGAYNIIESYALVQMTAPTAGYAGLVLESGTGGTDLSSVWKDGTLTMGPRVGYTTTDPVYFNSAAGSTFWVGIGEGVAGAAHFGATGTAGTVYWFTSSDGLTWTQRKTAPTPGYANAVGIALVAGEGNATTTWDNFNVTPTIPDPVGHSIYASHSIGGWLSTDGPVNLGTKFSMEAANTILAGRYWKGDEANNGATVTMTLYGAAGAVLAQATRVQQVSDPVGWVTVRFPTPPAVTTGVEYTIGYRFSAGTTYFTNQAYPMTAFNKSPFIVPANHSVYSYTAGVAQPTGAGSYDYAVDVIAQNPGATTPTSVLALDSDQDDLTQQWFNDRYAEGVRLFITAGTPWAPPDYLTTANEPRAQVEAQFGMAIAAGMKIGLYTRNPSHYNAGLDAAGIYLNQLQFFALDVEPDPGTPVTREMVDGVRARGVRPIIYAGSGFWDTIQGTTANDFTDVPLWDTQTNPDLSQAVWQAKADHLAGPPVVYGGWNTPTTMRIGVQQKFDVTIAGVLTDLNSFDASFLLEDPYTPPAMQILDARYSARNSTSTETVSSFTYTPSAGVQAGDLLVAIVTCAAGRTFNIPVGWFSRVMGDTGGGTVFLVTKVAEAGEGPTTFTISGSATAISYAHLDIRNATYRNRTAQGSTTSGSIITAGGMTAEAGQALLAMFSQTVATTASTVTHTPPAGMTQLNTWTPSSGSGYPSSLSLLSNLTAGATGDKSATTSTESTNRRAVALLLDPEGPNTPLTARRYYDTASTVAAIQAATTVAEVKTALEPMSAVYGKTISINDAGGALNPNFNSSPITTLEPNLRESALLLVDEMAKYPPSFIASTTMSGIYLVKDMTSPDNPGRDYGGMTSNPPNAAFVDINGTSTVDGPSDDGVRGVTLIIHHELMHVFRFSWPVDFASMESEWVVNNPPGFVYDPVNWEQDPSSPRPTGFARDYGIHSYVEDTAEVWGHMMSTILYNRLQQWTATDTGLAGKVAMMKRWMAVHSENLISTDSYYSSVHTEDTTNFTGAGDIGLRIGVESDYAATATESSTGDIGLQLTVESDYTITTTDQAQGDIDLRIGIESDYTGTSSGETTTGDVGLVIGVESNYTTAVSDSATGDIGLFVGVESNYTTTVSESSTGDIGLVIGVEGEWTASTSETMTGDVGLLMGVESDYTEVVYDESDFIADVGLRIGVESDYTAVSFDSYSVEVPAVVGVDANYVALGQASYEDTATVQLRVENYYGTIVTDSATATAELLIGVESDYTTTVSTDYTAEVELLVSVDNDSLARPIRPVALQATLSPSRYSATFKGDAPRIAATLHNRPSSPNTPPPV